MSSFANFKTHLNRLVDSFESVYPEIRSQGLDEANLRLIYLDPLFEALGWDIRNVAQAPLHAREVVIEPPSDIGGRKKRPDYVFRIGGIDRFLCEAKRPRHSIDRHFFQVQNYVYNSRLWVGILSDFEHLISFVVGAQPQKDRPFSPAPNWRLHYTEFDSNAQKIWDLLSKEAVSDGAIERFAQSVPKVTRRGKQGWLIPPDRNRTIDNDFLALLESERTKLARALHDANAVCWETMNLTEATQLIIDRLLFQRICEDRGIDIGKSLGAILDDWESRERQKGILWPALTSNFKHLSRTFNGGIYGRPNDAPHFIDDIEVSDTWLANFIETLSADDGQYLFNVIPVEILGSVYERFLGSIVLPNGKVEQKAEVRKAGGVYYTPRFIVDYVIGCALTPVLKGKSPSQIRKIKILDPACGSGGFLLRAFEIICRFQIDWFNKHPKRQKKSECYVDSNGHLKLTVGYKRKLLRDNIFGVDIDRQAVEVTQMSLYLRVLENESQESLENDHRLFPRETYLPDLANNIKCGNSLISTDCVPDIANDEDLLLEVNPFNWAEEFPEVFDNGGFDVVIGNPPYLNIDDTWGKGDFRTKYLKDNYLDVYNDKTDILFYFLKKAVEIAKNEVCFIVSRAFLEAYKANKLREWLSKNTRIASIVDFQNRQIFPNVGISTAVISLSKSNKRKKAQVWQLFDDESSLENLSDQLMHADRFRHHAVDQSHFGADAWVFAAEQVSLLLKKIDLQGTTLGDFLTVGQGMQTGRNTVFGKHTQTEVDLYEIPRSQFFIRARNSDISAYHIADSGERILYLEDVATFRSLPTRLKNYLKANAMDLKERAAYIRGDCEWWKYTWPLHKELYSQDRIYCPYLATENRFAIDEKRRFLGLTDTTVIFNGDQSENLKYILACLNSKLLTFRFRYIGKLKGGGIYEYFWNSISKIPIRRIDFKNKNDVKTHDRIVELVSNLTSMLQKHASVTSVRDKETFERSIAEIENKINEMIFKLYKISKKEAQLIDQHLS